MRSIGIEDDVTEVAGVVDGVRWLEEARHSLVGIHPSVSLFGNLRLEGAEVLAYLLHHRQHRRGSFPDPSAGDLPDAHGDVAEAVDGRRTPRVHGIRNLHGDATKGLKLRLQLCS